MTEQRVPRLQVAAADQQAQALTLVEQGRGGGERDDDVRLLAGPDRLQGAEGVFGLVRQVEFVVDLAQRTPA